MAWDWGPGFSTQGIYGTVRIEEVDSILVNDFYIK